MAPVVVTNQTQPAGVVMRLSNGGYMSVGSLTANVPTATLRFVEKLTSNGNVRDGYGELIPQDRAPTDQSVAYFNRTYGPYTLVNPAASGVISETFTPYIDLNNNQQYDPDTECLGQPAVLVYVVGDVLSSALCPTALFSYTATGTYPAIMTNQTQPASVTMALCNRGYMSVGSLTANVPTATLRFVEKLTSNGNVRDAAGVIIPEDRAPTDQSVAYFNRTYGPYTLVNPTLAGVISETFTPYIDLNNNQQFDSDSECLGKPAVLVYQVDNLIITTQNGLWTNTSTWSCRRAPSITDAVKIEHLVKLPVGIYTNAYWVRIGNMGRLQFDANSQLRLWQLNEL